MFVIKRDGTKEQVKFEKVAKRITRVAKDLKHVDPNSVAQKVIQGIYDGVTTLELDKLAIEVAYSMTTNHYEYDKLAVRLQISHLHKLTPSTFSEAIEKIYESVDVFGKKRSLIAEDVYTIIKKNAHILDSKIDYDRDYLLDYFGFKTLERSYLLKTNEYVNNKLIQRIVFRPQHLWMMVAVGIHKEDIDSALETYEMLSKKEAIHGTPTLFNAGLIKNQLSSCFLIAMKDDSVPGIYDTLKETALISQSAGGIGLHIHNIRSKGSAIFGTGGISNGIIPMLKNFHETAKYIDQGGGKRKGSFAIYLESHHADISEFLDLRKQNGKEELRARDLNIAIWVSDLFLKRVKDDGLWTLMDPAKCPNLSNAYGDEFEKLYTEYEINGMGEKTIQARDLWAKIVESQIETGQPYILNKDSCNKRSNQKNLGVISSGNLCAEIIQYSNAEETAVCLTGDTKILTKNGQKKIIDCNGEDVFVPFKSDIDLDLEESFEKAKLISNGIKKVFEINTAGGVRIKATEDHKFLVRTKIKYNNKNIRTDSFIWKKLKDLQKNDYLSTPINNDILNCNNNINESIDLEYVTAGWLLGDGWQRDKAYGVCFGSHEQFAKETVLKIVNKWHDESVTDSVYSRNKNVKEYTNKTGVIQWSTSKKGYIEKLNEKFGFSSNLGKNKYIPSKIFEATPLQIQSFLSGIFSADGTFHWGKNNKGYAGYSSASLKLLEDISLLLKSVGIHSRIVFGKDKRFENKFQGQLTIHNLNQIINFKNKIGYYLCPDKQIKINEYIKFKSDNSNKYEILPYNFCKIKEIKYVGQEEVFDLQMENKHNFIANGYTVHNCNLASVSLPSCIEGKKYKRIFNFQKLYDTTYQLTLNLNKIIDIEHYPTETARRSNIKHRPIGIGVQGLADVFALMRLSWESEEALKLNQNISETMYYASLNASADLAKKDGHYESYPGSPISEGILQFDMWDAKPVFEMWDWEKLKKKIKKYGVRNSLNIAIMPTASTSNILGNTEMTEPITSNIYTRQTLSGEFTQINKHLVEDLVELELWNDTMKQKIIASNGSIQNISEIPNEIKNIYKTVWELSQKILIDMAASRGPFVCQSQSMNLYIKDANTAKVTSAIFYAHSKSLKTLIYYLRTQGTQATKFTVSKEIENQVNESNKELIEGVSCSLDNPETCESCSG